MLHSLSLESRDMGEVVDIAVIQDSDGEINYPIEMAIRGQREGHFYYVGYRTYGDFVEHIWRFV
jgi:hypothetical protein